MNIQLFVACLLLAVGDIQAKTIFRRHKVARQLTTECEEGRRKCPGSDNCIRESWFCDGDNDCGDDSDEPSTCPPRVCPEGYFKCLTRNRCLTMTAICDGSNDCTDGSDEPTECSERECPAGFLKCNSGQCIDKTDYCTYARGCNDRTPLTDTVCPAVTCDAGYTKCYRLSKCIKNSYFCDSDNDCADGSDEADCSDRVCPPGEFKCNNGQCLDPVAVCTGRESYSCRDNTGTAAICANVQCPDGFAKCPSDGLCVSTSQLCDGTAQCSDSWDESEQHCNAPLVCPSGNALCPGVRRCINANYFCDTDNDCADRSDEDATFCSTRTCEEDRLRCDNGQCIDKAAFCQGYSYCRDNSLQRTAHNCPVPTSCPDGQAMCPGVGRCISTRYFCDSDNDCGDNSDEEPSFCSTRSCETNEVRCTSGQCIEREALCVGYSSCRDNSLNRNSTICHSTPVINPDDGSRPPSSDSASIDCMTAMMSLSACRSDLLGGIFTDEMSEEEKRQKLVGTDMSQLCSPMQQYVACLGQTLTACDNVELPSAYRQAITQTEEMLTTLRVMVDYICEQEIDVINRNKACLLQAASDQPQPEGTGQPPNILVIRTAYGSCMEHEEPNHEHPMCIAPALQACVKHVVANQCGDEIAGVLDGLASRVRQVACPQVAHHGPPQKKRRGYPSSFKAFYSFF